MKIFTIVLCFLSVIAAGQNDPLSREEKDEKNAARMNRINMKNDLAIFRKQLAASKEYTAEKARISSLQKAGKAQVRIFAVVDTGDQDDAANLNLLSGFIREDEGDNSVNIYEAVFDRKLKKIVSLKKTSDADMTEDDDADDQQDADKNTNPKKVNNKKIKETDDEDEETPAHRQKLPVKDDDH